MRDWDEIKRWRRAQRARLIEARRALPLTERHRVGEAIAARLAQLEELSGAPRCVGFYWPIRGEADLRPFISTLLERGFSAALPVVVEKNAPVEFHRYTAETRLTRQSVWGIPIPAERDLVQPDVLLIPLVGVDEACYRLGYGGGYYDRTLASLALQPFAVGVGYELGRLETIHPQPHDIPMDVVITEERMIERAGR